jgi:uncharacterized SAM-binding protein YcdF (DUF218 family)/glycosyltransferase involved in cell wall biosynthesis
MNQSFTRKSDILCISTIDWDFIWQGHQEIMSTLAAEGHRVLFLENTGVRTPNVRDLPRLRQRARNWWRGTKGFRQERPNLFVYSPLLLPLPYSRIARWFNRLVMLRALRRWMHATGFHRPIVWTFLPTPLALDLIRAVQPQLTIYYCIDDLPSSSPGARRLVPSEDRLFKEADLVFVTSEKLRQRAARISRNVHLFPFGVSFERFEQVRNESAAAPSDLAAIKRPIVGYMGGLHQWVDQDLLAGVAARMPDVSFVLVGPAQTDVSRLEKCSNVHLMGQRPHPDVPKYVKAFDVGVVPYRIAEYTANVYPTKLNEYLVMGVPVVATDLPEIRRFNTEHGDVLSVASDAEGFAVAIRTALNGTNPGAVAQRIAAAEANSWQSRIAEMNDVIAAALDTKSATEQRWDAALRRVYRGARSHAARVIVAIAAIYLLVFQTNVLWWLAEPLKIVDSPAPADAIVVFAGGVGESGKAGGGQQERLRTAIDLYKAGHAPVMILSSGFVYSFHEAEVMRALAIDQGIPPSQIVLEEHATNTYENVKFVDAILRDHRWQRVLLVSSPYHMRRALMVWRKVAPDVTVIATPPERTQFYDHAYGATLEQVRGILQEYVAIGAYWRRGWL